MKINGIRFSNRPGDRTVEIEFEPNRHGIAVVIGSKDHFDYGNWEINTTVYNLLRGLAGYFSGYNSDSVSYEELMFLQAAWENDIAHVQTDPELLDQERLEFECCMAKFEDFEPQAYAVPFPSTIENA